MNLQVVFKLQRLEYNWDALTGRENPNLDQRGST
jgi:hypothetical protein